MAYTCLNRISFIPYSNMPSAQMHELGHNLNFAHSGEGDEERDGKNWQYEDETGMMGWSSYIDEGPVMVSET